jgi:hypothetical protein
MPPRTESEANEFHQDRMIAKKQKSMAVVNSRIYWNPNVRTRPRCVPGRFKSIRFDGQLSVWIAAKSEVGLRPKADLIAPQIPAPRSFAESRTLLVLDIIANPLESY